VCAPSTISTIIIRRIRIRIIIVYSPTSCVADPVSWHLARRRLTVQYDGMLSLISARTA